MLDELYIASEWVVKIVMIFIVTRKKSPTQAISWLLLIFFFPWGGAVLYLFLGSNWLPRRRLRHYKKVLEVLQAQLAPEAQEERAVRPELDEAHTNVIALAQALGQYPILGDNQLEFISKTYETIERLVADIDEAEHHVHIMAYIYFNDETGRKVADALCRAAERGVTCRVLVDAVGSAHMLRTLARKMRDNGVDVRPMLPVGTVRRRMYRIDLRNHRKVYIVDGKVAYTGSQNIVNATYDRDDLVWYDLIARVQGPVVLELQTVFLGDWYAETEELLDAHEHYQSAHTKGGVPMQVLPSGPTYPVENYQRLAVAAVHGAQREVTIVTPYFIPDDSLMQALESAAMRGARVRVVVPKRTDKTLVGAASRAYYEPLVERGVEVYLFGEGLSHAKIIAVDDSLSLMGTSNFDIRSFRLNYEVTLVIYGTEAGELIHQEVERYIEQCDRLEPEKWKQRHIVPRTAENFAKLLSPVL